MIDRCRRPTIAGPWIPIAGNPDLGERTDPKQQPVDFAIWQAADGSWQLWSCVRGVRCGGMTRLFHGWESESLLAPDWRPMGVAMEADPAFGETPGGLQAPHVVRVGRRYIMAYGDWVHICFAESEDGKSFRRMTDSSGNTGRFSEGREANARDPILIEIEGRWHCYYTAFPGDEGAVYCRTSDDFIDWSPAIKTAFGGEAGTGRYAAECPHVIRRHDAYYLFRTQRYGTDAVTRIYRSNDPFLFGIDEDDRYLIGRLPVAAPEIVRHEDTDCIAALNPGLDGIRIARLGWID